MKYQSLDSMILHNKNKLYEKHPDLFDQDDLVTKEFRKYSKVLQGANSIDSIDQYLGPGEIIARTSFDEGYLYGAAIRLFEVMITKAPFVLYYAAKTKDILGVAMWTANEYLCQMLPFGELANIAPLYSWRANYVVRKKVRKKMEKGSHDPILN